MADSTGSDADPICTCKVGRAAAKRDLPSLHSELVTYWTGAETEQHSIRELTTHVNQQILESAMTDAGVQYKDGDVENIYRLLTDDDVSSGDRISARNELEHEGVDVDTVESEFVSHQTVHNHLRTCLDTSISAPDDEEQLARAQNKLDALTNRSIAVTESAIEQLERNDTLAVCDTSVLVSITVLCEECNTRLSVRDLFERRECNCDLSDT